MFARFPSRTDVILTCTWLGGIFIGLAFVTTDLNTLPPLGQVATYQFYSLRVYVIYVTTLALTSILISIVYM